MKITFKIILLVVLLIQISESQQKLGQTGFKFLNVGLGARTTGMAEAFTSLEQNSLSMFYNPASMARQENLIDFSVGNASWIADINHQNLSLSINPLDGSYGVFGLSLQSVDYGLIEGTILANNDKGFLDESDGIGLNLKPTAMNIGLGYAKALSDKFQVGGNIKYVIQDLGKSIIDVNPENIYQIHNNKLKLFAYDFGLIYRTGYKSLNIGMSIRNFAEEVKYEKENFQLPLIFRIGASINAIDFIDEIDKNKNSLLISVDATHPRDFPEQINIGAEYKFMKMLSLRVGSMLNNDEYNFTSGFGVEQEIMNYNFSIDYSHTPFGIFNSVDRISIQMSF